MYVRLLKKTWPFQKAAQIKNLHFEKLEAILGKLQAQEAALASLAANDTSVLQTLVYLVERAQEDQKHRQQYQSMLERRVASLESALEELKAQQKHESELSATAPDAPENGVRPRTPGVKLAE